MELTGPGLDGEKPGGSSRVHHLGRLQNAGHYSSLQDKRYGTRVVDSDGDAGRLLRLNNSLGHQDTVLFNEKSFVGLRSRFPPAAERRLKEPGTTYSRPGSRMVVRATHTIWVAADWWLES